MLLFSFVSGEQIPDAAKPKALQIDEQLFRRIGASDMTAFDELYHLTERTLYAYALSLAKNHEEALDLMQDTYVKVISAAHLYKPMGKPLAWLFTIAKNLYLSKLRKNKREVYSDSGGIADGAGFSYVTDPEDKIVLEAALNLLSDEERQIVLLHAVSGLKHMEIAHSIGLTLSTTLSKYHRALKKLRYHLEERGTLK